MRGSIKIGKLQYFAMHTGTKVNIEQLANEYRLRGNLARVRKGKGTASKEYILYVLPKKPKR